jgi:hypothetical protein
MESPGPHGNHDVFASGLASVWPECPIQPLGTRVGPQSSNMETYGGDPWADDLDPTRRYELLWMSFCEWVDHKRIFMIQGLGYPWYADLAFRVDTSTDICTHIYTYIYICIYIYTYIYICAYIYIYMCIDLTQFAAIGKALLETSPVFDQCCAIVWACGDASPGAQALLYHSI